MVWHAPAGSRRSDVGATRSDSEGAASRLHELEAEAASTPSMAATPRPGLSVETLNLTLSVVVARRGGKPRLRGDAGWGMRESLQIPRGGKEPQRSCPLRPSRHAAGDLKPWPLVGFLRWSRGFHSIPTESLITKRFGPSVLYVALWLASRNR